MVSLGMLSLVPLFDADCRVWSGLFWIYAGECVLSLCCINNARGETVEDSSVGRQEVCLDCYRSHWL